MVFSRVLEEMELKSQPAVLDANGKYIWACWTSFQSWARNLVELDSNEKPIGPNQYNGSVGLPNMKRRIGLECGKAHG